MAAYLALKNKQTGEIVEGDALIDLDNAICVALDVEPHPVNWYMGWMDRVGLRLALGATFAELRERYANEHELLRVVEYLDARFDNASYAAR